MTELVAWSVEGMTEEEALEKWPELAEKPGELMRRAKLSVQASQRHQQVVDPETGRRAFGGPQPGSGRPRKRRAADVIAELAQGDRQKDVVDALFSGLSRRNPAAVRTATAMKILDVERKERELEMAEEEHERKPRDELEKGLARVLARLGARGELPDLAALSARQPFDAEGTAEPVE